MGISKTTVGIAAILLALGPTVSAQDAMFVDSSGNVGIGTNTPTTATHLVRADGTAKLLVEETAATTAARELFELSNNGGPFFIFRNTDIAQSYSFAMGATGHFILSHQQTSGVQFRLTQQGDLTIAGSLNESSSRSAKDQIVEVDSGMILDKLDQLAISEWHYKGNQSNRHVGPMAEDFYAAFGLGPDNKHIAVKDLAGVALAAAKALKVENDRLKAKVAEVDELKAELQALKERVASLTRTE